MVFIYLNNYQIPNMRQTRIYKQKYFANCILSLIIKQKSYINISYDKLVLNESPSASEIKPIVQNDIYYLKRRKIKSKYSLGPSGFEEIYRNSKGPQR